MSYNRDKWFWKRKKNAFLTWVVLRFLGRWEPNRRPIRKIWSLPSVTFFFGLFGWFRLLFGSQLRLLFIIMVGGLDFRHWIRSRRMLCLNHWSFNGVRDNVVIVVSKGREKLVCPCWLESSRSAMPFGISSPSFYNRSVWEHRGRTSASRTQFPRLRWRHTSDRAAWRKTVVIVVRKRDAQSASSWVI